MRGMMDSPLRTAARRRATEDAGTISDLLDDFQGILDTECKLIFSVLFTVLSATYGCGCVVVVSWPLIV
jgi:hypothetical protein